MKKNVLVFPCGSEIGLEIHRSLRYSAHFRLFGGSSVEDHGRFVYDEYIGEIPFHYAPDFIEVMARIVRKFHIDAIYPAMDTVSVTLKSNQQALGCYVIGSSASANAVCASKKKTYQALAGKVDIPAWSDSLDTAPGYPLFIKPDVGYGARNVLLAKNRESAESFVSSRGGESKFLYCENLSGDEFTVDCFSDRYGELLFVGGRKRERISNGISVCTKPASVHVQAFQAVARRINDVIRPRGAWFFQMKEDRNGRPKLLEVAARLGGSSSLFRGLGVNFALLSVFDGFGLPVMVEPNQYDIELDRALSNSYRLGIEYSKVYVDYDDCILLKEGVNVEIMRFLFSALREKKKLILISRHDGDLMASLVENRIHAVFDEVIHLEMGTPKSRHIDPEGAIFIDDSYVERSEVKRVHGIPVFSPDMIEMLL